MFWNYLVVVDADTAFFGSLEQEGLQIIHFGQNFYFIADADTEKYDFRFSAMILDNSTCNT